MAPASRLRFVRLSQSFQSTILQVALESAMTRVLAQASFQPTIFQAALAQILPFAKFSTTFQSTILQVALFTHQTPPPSPLSNPPYCRWHSCCYPTRLCGDALSNPPYFRWHRLSGFWRLIGVPSFQSTILQVAPNSIFSYSDSFRPFQSTLLQVALKHFGLPYRIIILSNPPYYRWHPLDEPRPWDVTTSFQSTLLQVAHNPLASRLEVMATI